MASYTEVTVSSYNAATVPVDDGTATATNLISWSIIKTKLGDPLKTAADSINTNVAAAITTITTNLATANTNLDTANTSYDSAVAVLGAPSTTAMLFMQTSAPTGWTKGSTHNDKALRLVSGSASTGGSTAFTSVFTSQTITSSNMPSHTHDWSSGSCTISWTNGTLGTSASLTSKDNVDAGGFNHSNSLNETTAVISGTGTVSGTTGSAGSGTAMDFAVRYVDVIIATKD